MINTVGENQSIAMIAIVVALVILPIIMFIPEGIALEGLSSGFLMVLDNPFHLAIMLVVGVWSNVIGRDAILLLPLSFILMFSLGSFMVLDISSLPAIYIFMLGSVLVLLFSISLMPVRDFIISVAVSGVVSYNIGVQYMHQIPAKTAPLFYIVGEVVALSLILSAMVVFGSVLLNIVPWLNEEIKAYTKYNSEKEFQSSFAIPHKTERESTLPND